MEAHSGILQLGGYCHTIQYEPQSNLPVLYTGSKLRDPMANISSMYTQLSWEPPYTVQELHAFNEELAEDGGMHHNLSKVQLYL